jgi:protein-disulfide isomerase
MNSGTIKWVALALVIVASVASVALLTGEAPQPPAVAESTAEPASPSPELLVRPHAPVLGAPDAPVTIVEVFDPSCEACRAFYPEVKQVLAAYPGRVRLVIRYATFHQGSDIAVGILEMARLQGKYQTVLEALLQRQPEWAVHGAPNLALAWRIAQAAGLDISDARQREALPSLGLVLKQDKADIDALLVERTPTFYVNGRLLPQGSPQALRDRVAEEVAKAARAPAQR